MDLTKKRKADDNGRAYPLPSDLGNPMAGVPPSSLGLLSPEDAEKILEPFTKEQLLPIIHAAVLRHPDVLEAVRAVADADPVQRKSKGYGFVTLKHIDAAILALKEPHKKIDGRITVTHLAAAGSSSNSHSRELLL